MKDARIETERNTSMFIEQLQAYKHVIDADIEQYAMQMQQETTEHFGAYPNEAVRAYCEILSRGGKRIRGALTMLAYEMAGGRDTHVAMHAARAIEMLHAYILMADDIQDRSEVRRGGPSAHFILKQYHESHHLKDDAGHFGESVAINGFLFGAHKAIDVIANLDVPAGRKIDAIRNVNYHFIATAHGQSLDIFNEVVQTVDEEAVNNVLLWKTAFYTFMNPLQLGAILAGVSQKTLTQLESYSLHAGRVFQITDDILGIFSEESVSGKSPLDDIKEGKRTILTVKAIELAPKADAYFLEQMLGNRELTQAEFLKCRSIIAQSGALDYARQQAQISVSDAIKAVDSLEQSHSPQAEFLRILPQFLLDRKA